MVAITIGIVTTVLFYHCKVTPVTPKVTEKYKLRHFAKWAKKERISDPDLLGVITEMNRGLLGDRLGSHVYKKRLKVEGRGKRGGARAIVMYKEGDVTLFIYGYLKSQIEDISDKEVLQLRLFAQEFLRLSSIDRMELVTQGKLISIQG